MSWRIKASSSQTWSRCGTFVQATQKSLLKMECHWEKGSPSLKRSTDSLHSAGALQSRSGVGVDVWCFLLLSRCCPCPLLPSRFIPKLSYCNYLIQEHKRSQEWVSASMLSLTRTTISTSYRPTTTMKIAITTLGETTHRFCSFITGKYDPCCCWFSLKVNRGLPFYIQHSYWVVSYIVCTVWCPRGNSNR